MEMATKKQSLRSSVLSYSIIFRGYTMIGIEKWTWIIDKKETICRNAENNISVKMNMEDGVIKGKLQDIPMELFGKIAQLEDGEKIIMQIVKKAEEEYLKGCTHE